MESKIRQLKVDFFRKNGHYFGITSHEQINAAIDPWDSQKRYLSIKCSKETSDKFEKILIERIKDFYNLGYYFYYEDTFGATKELRIQMELAEKLNEFFPDKWYLKNDQASLRQKEVLISKAKLLFNIDLDDNKTLPIGATLPCSEADTKQVAGLLISANKNFFDFFDSKFKNLINEHLDITNNKYLNDFKMSELAAKYIASPVDQKYDGLIFISLQAIDFLEVVSNKAANKIVTTKTSAEKVIFGQNQKMVVG